MQKTSIIILTYNNMAYSQVCIASIRHYTPPGSYEIIVVDNRSTDGTVEWLKSQPDLKLVLNGENKGFPAGCNQGIRAAEEGNDILLLNNDTIVTPRWLENLQACLYSDETVGAVGPVTNACSYAQAVPTSFKSFDEMLLFAQQINCAQAVDYEQRVRLVGFCMLIKRRVVDQIGLLDERFTPGNFEDDDYSYRIIKAGYKLLLCRNAFIYHFGSASFGEDQPEFVRHLSVNAGKFREKWGFDSHYSSFIRQEVIDMIREPADKPIRVLDVGCGCGAVLLRIKYLFKNAQLYGIELNRHSADIAARFADVRCGNVEDEALEYGNDFFDYIIFSDVLEHLVDPAKVLERMDKYLKPGGYVLASIPNVMHYSVISGLLNGFWTYTDAGILDRTHLRFFTLYEIGRLFSSLGFHNLEYVPVVFRAPGEKEKAFIDQLARLAGEDKRRLFEAYQYLVKAGSTRQKPAVQGKATAASPDGSA